MPRPIRANFRLSADDDRRLEELAALVTPEGEPNRSLAVRIAVREALERRRQDPETRSER